MVEVVWSWTLSTQFPSAVDAGREAIDQLLAALTAEQWDGRDYFHVQMAAEEAMVNAVKHGNNESPAKQVKVDFRVSPNVAYLKFEDEGEGFSPDDLPDPRDDAHLECTNGRGVMLIREMMTEVRYNERGNQVEMWKRRMPVAEDVSGTEDADDSENADGSK